MPSIDLDPHGSPDASHATGGSPRPSPPVRPLGPRMGVANRAEQAGGLQALSYFILYTYMIPISLFVTIEISRLTQALFMFSDNEMRSPQGERMRPNNSNLNEDLGRVCARDCDRWSPTRRPPSYRQRWFRQRSSAPPHCAIARWTISSPTKQAR